MKLGTKIMRKTRMLLRCSMCKKTEHNNYNCTMTPSTQPVQQTQQIDQGSQVRASKAIQMTKQSQTSQGMPKKFTIRIAKPNEPPIMVGTTTSQGPTTMLSSTRNSIQPTTRRSTSTKRSMPK